MGGVDFTYFNIIPSFLNSVTCILTILSLDNTRLFETYYTSPDPTNINNPSWSQQHGAFEICRTYATQIAPIGSCYDQSAAQCDFRVFDPVAAMPMPFTISPCSGWNAYRALSIMSVISSGFSAIILSYFGFARLSSPDRTPLWYSGLACGFSFFSGICGMIAMAIILGVFISSGDELLWGFDLMVAGWVIAFCAGLFNLSLILKERKSVRRHIGERENIAGTVPPVVVSTPAGRTQTEKGTTVNTTTAAPATTAAISVPIDNAATASKLDPSHLGPLPNVPAHRKSRSNNLSVNAPSINGSPSQTPGVTIHIDDGNDKEGEIQLQPYEPKAQD